MTRPIHTVVASLASLILSGTLLGHSAVEPVPRGEEWWKQRQQTLNQRSADAGEKAEILFIGDSITQGWENEGKEVWAQHFAPRNAVNLGIGGDRTQHVLWRLENGNLKGVKPKAAVVMIGTNNSNGEDNSVSQIAEGVTAIVAKLRQALPDTKVLLVGIFPRGESPNNQRGKVLQVNQILSRLADGKSVFWIDFGSRYVDAQGLIPRDLMPDYLHLSPAAYQIWADELEGPLVRVAGVTQLGNSSAPNPTAKTAEGLTGKWKFTTPGPDGQPVTFPMELTQSGNRLTGRFSRGGDRWLQIEDGKVEGSEFSWTVKRDRPDGQSMIYQMSGKVSGGELAGSAKTSMDGNDITTSWTARRE